MADFERKPRHVWRTILIVAGLIVVVGVAVPATHRIDPVTALSVVHDTVNAESRTFATVTKRVRPPAPGVELTVGDAATVAAMTAVPVDIGVAEAKKPMVAVTVAVRAYAGVDVARMPAILTAMKEGMLRLFAFPFVPSPTWPTSLRPQQ